MSARETVQGCARWENDEGGDIGVRMERRLDYGAAQERVAHAQLGERSKSNDSEVDGLSGCRGLASLSRTDFCVVWLIFTISPPVLSLCLRGPGPMVGYTYGRTKPDDTGYGLFLPVRSGNPC